MRSFLYSSLVLFFAGMMVFAAVSCGTQSTEPTNQQLIVAERQQARLVAHHDGYYDVGDFIVDVPLFGPQPLMDSLAVFLNKELYDLFEFSTSWDDEPKHFSEKDLFQDDMPRLLRHYEDRYKPFQESLYNPFSFSLLMIAQTDSYVTYGLEFYHCGASCGSEFLCYTFSKKDGHRCEIIDHENLLKYVEDNWRDSDYIKNVFGDYSDCFDFGLLEDGLVEVLQSASNHHYWADVVETDNLWPYLTQDAQQLIRTKGDGDVDYWDRSLGRRIGEAETVDGESVVLMRQVLRWGFDALENDDLIQLDYEEGYYPCAIEYVMKDGRFELFDGDFKTLALVGETKDYLVRIDNIGEKYRYASWKHTFNMDDEPDLVVDNGWYDMESASYVFENNGYGYCVQLINPYAEDPYDLLVYHGKELLLRQHMTALVDPAENASIEYTSLGRVMGADGGTIYIDECVQAYYGGSVSYDYFLKAWDENLQPVEVFEKISQTGEKYYQAYSDTITSYFGWYATVPYGDFYAFNEAGNMLYCACGQDRFSVYQFDGQHFVYRGEDGGFWLHPSLRSFSRMVNVCETKDFVVRVDEVDAGGRYALWNKGAESYPEIMERVPDLVIYNGQLDRVMIGYSEYNLSKFENKGYQYIVDEYERTLSFYKGEELVLDQDVERIYRP